MLGSEMSHVQPTCVIAKTCAHRGGSCQLLLLLL
jgi:hypothetical protein